MVQLWLAWQQQQTAAVETARERVHACTGKSYCDDEPTCKQQQAVRAANAWHPASAHAWPGAAPACTSYLRQLMRGARGHAHLCSHVQRPLVVVLLNVIPAWQVLLVVWRQKFKCRLRAWWLCEDGLRQWHAGLKAHLQQQQHHRRSRADATHACVRPCARVNAAHLG